MISINSGKHGEGICNSSISDDAQLSCPKDYNYKNGIFCGGIKISDKDLELLRKFWPNKFPVFGNSVCFYGSEARTMIKTIKDNWEVLKGLL